MTQGRVCRTGHKRSKRDGEAQLLSTELTKGHSRDRDKNPTVYVANIDA